MGTPLGNLLLGLGFLGLAVGLPAPVPLCKQHVLMRVSMAIVHDAASMHYCPHFQSRTILLEASTKPNWELLCILPLGRSRAFWGWMFLLSFRCLYKTKFEIALHPPSWAVPSFLGLDVFIVLSVLVLAGKPGSGQAIVHDAM